MDNERILTLHPQAKQGVNILKSKYNVIKQFILSSLENQSEISFKDLSDSAVKALSDNFEGKVLWYLVSVKLDLEARNIIERVPKSSPQKLRLKT